MACTCGNVLAIIEYQVLPGVEGVDGEVAAPALLLEAKSRATQEPGTARGRGLWAIPTKSAQQTAVGQYKPLQAPYQRALAALAGKVRRGTMTAREGARQAQEKMSGFYRRAYLLGMQAGGYRKYEIPPKDARWVTSAVKDEMTYLRRWFRDISDPDRPMRFPISIRAKMYADTLDHVFSNGRVNVMPAKYVIYWVIDKKKENCPDCLWLQRNSPFTKLTLPTTPRAGDTRCLFRCGCKLIMRQADTARLGQINRKHKNAAAALKAMKAATPRSTKKKGKVTRAPRKS